MAAAVFLTRRPPGSISGVGRLSSSSGRPGWTRTAVNPLGTRFSFRRSSREGEAASRRRREHTASRQRRQRTQVSLGRGSVGGRFAERISETADEALDALVVALERVLAENGLALRVVELQVDPVHAVVLALEVGLADELAAQP